MITAPAGYGKVWQDQGNDYWVGMYSEEAPYHETFLEWLESHRRDTKSILEVGCGSGVYMTGHPKHFFGMVYTGIDISQSGIDYAKANAGAEFIAEDFLQWDDDRVFDIVFSHCVIDHVYDPYEFLRKIVAKTRKRAFISTGGFTDWKPKDLNYNADLGFYLNTIPLEEVETVLLGMLSASEFTITPFETYGHIIEINRGVHE